MVVKSHTNPEMLIRKLNFSVALIIQEPQIYNGSLLCPQVIEWRMWNIIGDMSGQDLMQKT